MVAVAPALSQLPHRKADLSGLDSIVAPRDNCRLTMRAARDAKPTNLARWVVERMNL